MPASSAAADAVGDRGEPPLAPRESHHGRSSLYEEGTENIPLAGGDPELPEGLLEALAGHVDAPLRGHLGDLAHEAVEHVQELVPELPVDLEVLEERPPPARADVLPGIVHAGAPPADQLDHLRRDLRDRAAGVDGREGLVRDAGAAAFERDAPDAHHDDRVEVGAAQAGALAVEARVAAALPGHGGRVTWLASLVKALPAHCARSAPANSSRRARPAAARKPAARAGRLPGRPAPERPFKSPSRPRSGREKGPSRGH